MSACAIIVSYRTGEVLEACLAALTGAEALDEIIIVDNGNAPTEVETLDRFAATNPRINLIRGHGNVGFARACNLGGARAKSDVFVFVNPDVILAPNAITQLASTLAPGVGVVGGDLRDRQGQPARGSRRERLTLWRAAISFLGLSRLERLTPMLRDFNRQRDPLPTAPIEVGAVSGALMALRRDVYEKLGGFDEDYFLHFEDIDLCRRAEKAGLSVVFAPGPHGVHVGATSDAKPASIARHKATSFGLYFRKHGDATERVLGAAVSAALSILLPLTARGR